MKHYIKYKPGQLMTIKNKVYRVVKAKKGITCDNCPGNYKTTKEYPACIICLDFLPPDYYLEEIKPKR